MQSFTLSGTSMSWNLWVGSKAATATGPIVIYWHATGTTYSEAQEALGDNIATITGLGGVVASAVSTTSTGTNTGDAVWYTGDINWADFIIACAIEQLNIDTTHIHAAGYSAGALQTGYMWYARSGYLASTIVYSGGVGFPPAMQDPSNAPSLIGAHGTPGDVYKRQGNRQLLTTLLKQELGFEGFLISDWNAIDQLGPDYKKCAEIAVNAGMDMLMVTNRYRELYNNCLLYTSRCV